MKRLLITLLIGSGLLSSSCTTSQRYNIPAMGLTTVSATTNTVTYPVRMAIATTYGVENLLQYPFENIYFTKEDFVANLFCPIIQWGFTFREYGKFVSDADYINFTEPAYEPIVPVQMLSIYYGWHMQDDYFFENPEIINTIKP